MKYCCSLLVAVLLVGGAGCFHRSKPSPEIATTVEQEFKQRWIAKRMGELQASGVSDPREARRQATEDFRKKFEYLRTTSQPDPSVGGPTP